MSGIFISYRQQDTGSTARRLHDALAAHIGPGKILRDIQTTPGADFGQRIHEVVGSCDAFLVIIGKGWLVNRNPPGKRAIGIPRDWVLKEIEAAMARPHLLVVPVLVEGAAMPAEQELPYSIRSLAVRNPARVTDADWDHQVRQLTETLERVVERRR